LRYQKSISQLRTTPKKEETIKKINSTNGIPSLFHKWFLHQKLKLATQDTNKEGIRNDELFDREIDTKNLKLATPTPPKKDNKKESNSSIPLPSSFREIDTSNSNLQLRHLPKEAEEERLKILHSAFHSLLQRDWHQRLKLATRTSSKKKKSARLSLSNPSSIHCPSERLTPEHTLATRTPTKEGKRRTIDSSIRSEFASSLNVVIIQEMPRPEKIGAKTKLPKTPYVLKRKVWISAPSPKRLKDASATLPPA
jgi:hypothetical protein